MFRRQSAPPVRPVRKARGSPSRRQPGRRSHLDAAHAPCRFGRGSGESGEARRFRRDGALTDESLTQRHRATENFPSSLCLCVRPSVELHPRSLHHWRRVVRVHVILEDAHELFGDVVAAEGDGVLAVGVDGAWAPRRCRGGRSQGRRASTRRDRSRTHHRHLRRGRPTYLGITAARVRGRCGEY